MTGWPAVLDFEAAHVSTPRREKDQAIFDTFGISGPVYTQRLMRAIEEVDALAYRPMLVARLRRQRDHLRKVRTGRGSR